jgi:nitroimidazol reductase NimA-like FMN-containing flavoprotein (pyridoxamine 5'-phosphate oxidase superfamily)
MTKLWTRAEALEPDECLRLLASVRWGRVGFTGAAGPQILPVNHTVLDGAIVFRTDLYSAVADGTRGTVVAFEADELDDRLQSGWSVLAVGEAQHVEDRAEMVDLFRRMGEPWAPGSRPLVARIVPADLTGRRFHRT